MISLRRINGEVFYADAGVVRVGAAEVGFLCERATESPRGRARICAHLDPGDGLHEMMIALRRGGYVRPHRHLGREESFHAIDGEADVVIFGDTGGIENVIRMGTGLNDTWIFRLNASRFHTVLVRTPFFVVHEVTQGPFDPKGTVFAPWAPEEDDLPNITAFLADVEARLQER